MTAHCHPDDNAMKNPAGPDLCHCLAARRSARYLTRLYDAHLAPVGLSISQFSILALVDAHPTIAIAQLAEHMVMERTTLVRALRPLQNRGYLDSTPCGPKSAIRLSLSSAGTSAYRMAIPLWKNAQKTFEKSAGKDRAVGLRDTVLGLPLGG